MIQSFGDEGTQDIFNGLNTRASRRSCPMSLWKVAARKLDLLDSALTLDDIKIPPGNKLELLAGTRRGQHSIRINDQYRICFLWSDVGPAHVEIVDYH